MFLLEVRPPWGNFPPNEGKISEITLLAITRYVFKIKLVFWFHKVDCIRGHVFALILFVVRGTIGKIEGKNKLY